MLERILEMKESTINDLKEQSHWLKERVERQEEQCARDRAIIFATTQTMQRVIENNQKKPAIQAMMEFFGFVPIKSLSNTQQQLQQGSVQQGSESAFANIGMEKK